MAAAVDDGEGASVGEAPGSVAVGEGASVAGGVVGAEDPQDATTSAAMRTPRPRVRVRVRRDRLVMGLDSATPARQTHGRTGSGAEMCVS